MFFSLAKTVLKSLFKKPVTVQYPFGPRTYFKGTRGSIDIVIAQCIFCGICQRKCPTGAIKVDKAAKKWIINRLRCISCKGCVEVCPKKCLTQNNQYSPSVVEKKEDTFQ
jgi:ech hydrogenase subunit F